MSTLKSQSPKVQVKGAFGQTEQIALDTNRITQHSETLFKAANVTSLKPDAFYSDALIWVLTPATVMRSIKLLVLSGLLPELGAYVLIAFLLAPPLLLISYVLIQASNSHTSAVFYRLGLIASGLVLALL